MPGGYLFVDRKSKEKESKFDMFLTERFQCQLS